MKYFWIFDIEPYTPLRVVARCTSNDKFGDVFIDCEFAVAYDTEEKRFLVPRFVNGIRVNFCSDPWDVEYRLPELLAEHFGIAINENHTWYDLGDELIFFLAQ